jgi:hypothetical protein
MFMLYYKARVAKQLAPEPENDHGRDSTGQLIEEDKTSTSHSIQSLKSKRIIRHGPNDPL